MSPSVPQEIIGNIMSWISDQKDTLIGASLVSRSFLAPCQALLFRNLHILGEGPNKLPKFRQSLERNPALATYPRSVTLQITKSLVTDPDVSWILNQLTRVSKLTLDTRATAPINWSDFSDDLRRSILECLRLPTVSALATRFVAGLPLSVFQDNPSLRRLTLVGARFEIPSPDTRSLPLHLEALSLSCSHFKESEDDVPFYGLILPAPRLFSFENLAELEIEVWNHTLMQIKHILGASGAALTMLTLSTRGPFDIDLSCLTKLSNLEIEVDLTPVQLDKGGDPRGRFQAMTRTLGAIKSTSLKRLRLRLEVDGPDLQIVDWDDFDEVLADLRRRAGLEQLTIEFEYPMFWDPFLDDWEIGEEHVIPLLPRYNSLLGGLKVMGS